ncbi:MAG TPA: multidrug ABC transporter substrate-binding protein, partial [Dehalococcoidia bacterium]|nr:multidrug ABC transporter substrate-binding protein [Dehalococcoidia bacterium]
AVISLMAIGRGAQESITSRIESLGTNLLFVRPGSSSQGGIFAAQGSAGS